MTHSRQLRALAVYLCFGLPLAFSCAREENGADDPQDQPGNDGGSAMSTAGKATAGSTNKAGSASAFGGTTGNGTAGSAAQAGKAAGGSAGSSSGGSSGAGGSSGTGGSAGSGGSNGVPPDVLMNASAIVYYETSHTTASDKTIQMKLHIVNQSADPLPLASVKIRYWFTAEATPALHQYYVGPSVKDPKAAFVNDGENSHALLTFGGNSIVKGGDINSSEIQLEMTGDPSTFDQSDDFSWDPSAKTATPNGKITLYLADTLIWGCEPSGECAGGGGGDGGAGPGGAPGAAGQGAGGVP
jgi:hypothetical protein